MREVAKDFARGDDCSIWLAEIQHDPSRDQQEMRPPKRFMKIKITRKVSMCTSPPLPGLTVTKWK